MGRRDKPVDHSRPARGRLAEHLRQWRETAGITYETLARRTGLSPATLKRAASGTVVPKRATAEAYVEGCDGGQEAVRAAGALWREARVEERGRLAQLRAPRPELIADAADLSRALEVVWEQAGALSLREIRERSGNPLALPVSSAARIVNRNTIPADVQQLQAFLTGCGVPLEQHTAWTAAFTRISSASAAATAAQEVPDEWNALRRQAALRRLQRLTSARPAPEQSPAVREQQWKHFLSLLPSATVEEIIAGGVKGYLASEAARNGRTHREQPLLPALSLAHDDMQTVFAGESTPMNTEGGRSGAGGAAKTKGPRRPSGRAGRPAARAQVPTVVRVAS
ncbi:helix-turn-helix transcriptional regulator [Streptomyces sp. NBC_01352]|uniref:helix-turn-helix domain-containing protein n=1 Tax=Streptomyces sp. NBC_01352 TaxID=2903834 RepID=UPI002E317CAA|nr:helix-turn-helix transcriptional regulator [Streptomyces sp. NBC_01352]